MAVKGFTVMGKNFLDHLKAIEDPRIAGMTTYALDEVLVSLLVGLLCGGDDFDEIEMICTEHLGWLQGFLCFKHGIAPAQTLRRVLQMLDPLSLERALSSWVASLQEKVSGVISIDGKTLRGSKEDQSGKGALHMVSAYAHCAGLMLAHRAVDEKSNEITAIPELLKMLEIEGCIVTIDAMGTQKEIAALIINQKADYLLSLKGNQGSLQKDVAEFFDDPVLLEKCLSHQQTDIGHGRIEERICHVIDASSWLCPRHPLWIGLRSIVQITAIRRSKKTGTTSTEKRLYISSLEPEPKDILAASRSHWGIENNLHYCLDVTFREDECRTRKDYSARNLATLRRATLNLLKQEPTKIALKRKRLKAALNPHFRKKLLAC
jgi:predicted transposase YbfD/YdcC